MAWQLDHPRLAKLLMRDHKHRWLPGSQHAMQLRLALSGRYHHGVSHCATIALLAELGCQVQRCRRQGLVGRDQPGSQYAGPASYVKPNQQSISWPAGTWPSQLLHARLQPPCCPPCRGGCMCAGSCYVSPQVQHISNSIWPSQRHATVLTLSLGMYHLLTCRSNQACVACYYIQESLSAVLPHAKRASQHVHSAHQLLLQSCAIQTTTERNLPFKLWSPIQPSQSCALLLWRGCRRWGWGR